MSLKTYLSMAVYTRLSDDTKNASFEQDEETGHKPVVSMHFPSFSQNVYKVPRSKNLGFFGLPWLLGQFGRSC